ncbi:MAG: glycosyltransferase family 4 protein [Sphingobacteriales bacterium]|nr:MAG: glycosyltransferase family 4 protein [Sphingobacteriales bacterium]
MNILFLTYQGDIAGSTNSVFYLAKGLADMGHTVVAGLRKQSLLYGMFANTRVITEEMTFGSRFDWVNMRQIREVVLRYQIQVINAQSGKDRYTSIFAKWIFRLPVVLVHTRRQAPKSIGGRLQNRFYIAGTDKIVVISPQLKQTFVQKGFPAHHLKVIMNGIPEERFLQTRPENTDALRLKFRIRPNDVVIGCVSRRKKQEQLIEALPMLKNEQIKVMFVGIEPGSLDAVVKKFSVKNPVLYAGVVPNEEVMDYYPLFNLSVLPSTMDGFGLVLVEAMGMGIPVVATRAQGIIDVLNNEQNGLWFEDGDIQTLAAQINRILTDNQLREKLIENGKNAAKNDFSLRHTVMEYLRLFEDLVKNRH